MVVKLALPKWAVREAGAPEKVWVHYASPADAAQLYVTVTWGDKTPTRLPEVPSRLASLAPLRFPPPSPPPLSRAA